MRAIDADALIADIKECIEAKDSNCEWEQVEGLEVALSCVDDATTIEPEQKKGTWLVHLYKLGRDRYECDQCQGRCDMGYRYCPNCGADMQGDSE